MSEGPQPRRIQRKRTKGWRMPEGAIYVGRPTKWGNPFWHAQQFVGLEASLNCYRDAIHGWNGLARFAELGDGPDHIAYEDHRRWLRRFGHHVQEAATSELRGKDLACWCPLDRPCHADILLEIANE